MDYVVKGIGDMGGMPWPGLGRWLCYMARGCCLSFAIALFVDIDMDDKLARLCKRGVKPIFIFV